MCASEKDVCWKGVGRGPLRQPAACPWERDPQRLVANEGCEEGGKRVSE